ncbi:MAG: metallophosphoesterase [Elusimicrobia bacterium]|nr:metallophosphoesterase [Elusimicrobiota bacterium]
MEPPVDWKLYGVDPALWPRPDLGERLGERLVERWAYDDLRETRRRRAADRIRLARLSARWNTREQLALLGGNPRGVGETFRFAVLGDAEPGRFWFSRALFSAQGAFLELLRDIQERRADFCVQLGDMVSRGSVRNYLSFFQNLSSLESPPPPYLTVIGNHDRRFPHGRADSSLYREIFGRTNYFFDRGAARFAALDTSERRLSRRQLLWLETALDTKARKVVFTHVPPAGIEVWKGLSGRLRGAGAFKEGSADFLRLMSRRRVDRVYFGHIHAFGVQDVAGVRYVLTGGGGSPLYPMGLQDRFHHYVMAEIGPKGVRDAVFCADGRSFEVPQAR